MVFIETDINTVLSDEPACVSTLNPADALADAQMTIPEDVPVIQATTVQAPTEALLSKANAQGINSLIAFDDCTEVAESVLMYASHIKKQKSTADWLGLHRQSLIRMNLHRMSILIHKKPKIERHTRSGYTLAWSLQSNCAQ